MLHYFQQRDRHRKLKIARGATTKFKRRRNEIKHEKLLEDTKKAKRERMQREGTYETGIGMDGGYTEADFEDQSIQCKRCKGFGHRTANSMGCKYYKPRKRKAVVNPTALRDADEADKLDCMPFDTPIKEEDDDDDDFFDADEFETSTAFI